VTLGEMEGENGNPLEFNILYGNGRLIMILRLLLVFQILA
jgi:hypothetical protein